MGAYADALNELNTATQPKSGGGSAEYGSVESLVRNKAAEYDIDPDLFVSLAKRESGLRPGARNPNPGSTAGGLFQFIDGTWNRYGNKRDKFDPEANADAAARMMREHLDMFGGDYNKALAAHHVGAGKAERALVDGSVGDVDVSTQKWLSDIYKGAGRDGAPEPSVSAPKAPKTDYSRAFEHFANTPGSTLDAQIKAGDKPKEEKISISKEIGAAIDSYQSNLWAIPAAMGSEYALQAMLDNKSAAEQQWQESGAPQSFDEMEFGKNFGNYFAHMALQSAPYMLEFMATGFGVGSAAKAALANTAKGVAEKAAMEAAKMGATKAAAQKAGEAAAASYMGKVYTASGVAGSYPSSVGDILSNQHEQAGKFDLPAAAALGVPYAALNAAGAEGMAVRAAARGLPKSAITKNGVAGFAGRAALTGAEAGVMEGSTETGQEVMNQLGRMAVDPNAKIDDKRALEAYKESFIAGGLLGGVPGAAAGGFRKAEDAKQQPPAPVANSPLTSAVNTAQHVQKQIDQANAPAMPDDHREQIIDMMEKRDGLTQYIGTLQDALDKADPASERTQELRGRLSDAVMRRDGLIKQLDAAKAFYGSDQMANIGPQNDPLLLGNEQMMRTYQVTKRLLENPGELDKQTRSELLGGLAMLRNPNLPETTRIDAAIGLLGTMDRMAEARAKQAADRATATQQAQQAAGIGPQKTPRVKAPLPAPAGSFANLAEFERFRVAELANIDQMRRDGAARQDSRKIEEANLREAHLQDIQRNIEANRIKETAAKRMDLLSRVLASNPQNPNRAFDRALRLDGFRDATFTEDEKATIASFSDLRAMQEEGIAGTPNEAGNFGIREKQAAPAPGRYQHLSNMLRSGWKSANKHQLISPAGEFYNLKGAGEVQFVRNKLNQKANNGSQSPRGGSQGGTDQGDFGVGGAGVNGPVPQGGGNGSGQANAIPDTGAPAGAIQSSEAVGNGGQSNNPLGTKVTEPENKQRLMLNLSGEAVETQAIHDIEYGELPGRIFFTRVREDGLFNVVDEHSGHSVFSNSPTELDAINGLRAFINKAGADVVRAKLEEQPKLQPYTKQDTAKPNLDSLKAKWKGGKNQDIKTHEGKISDESLANHPDIPVVSVSTKFFADKSPGEMQDASIGLINDAFENHGGYIVNIPSGVVITTTKSNAKHATNLTSSKHTPYLSHFAVSQKIGEILENAVLADGYVSKKDSQPYTTIYRMYAAVNIDGVAHRVKITLKQSSKDGLSDRGAWFYDHELTDVSKEPLPSRNITLHPEDVINKPEAKREDGGALISVRDLLSGVKRDSDGTTFMLSLPKQNGAPSGESAPLSVSQKVQGAESTTQAAQRSVAQRSHVRTYKTKSGKIGARIEKVVGPTGKVFYNYTGEWGAGSGHALAQMDKIESMWRKEKRGYTVVEADAVADQATDDQSFKDGLPRVAPEGIKGADKVRWLTGYDDAKKTSETPKQKTDTSQEPKAIDTKPESDWLGELFGSDSSQMQPVEQNKNKKVDLSGLVGKLREFSDKKLAEANDWASRQYKQNKTKVSFEGDGPTRNESMSISAANESRRNRNVDSLQHQAQMASNLANRIERGFDVQKEIEQAIRNAESDIKRDGKARFGGTRESQIEAYISNSMLGDASYGFGEGTLPSLIRKAYEQSQQKTDEAPKAAEQPDGGEIVSPTASPSLSDEMAGFTGVSDAEYALRKLSHADRQDGDVELGNGRFVTLEQAVSAAKENMDKADWSKPFQFNRVLDIAPIDWNTMVDAMKKWAASQQKTDTAAEPVVNHEIDALTVDVVQNPHHKSEKLININGDLVGVVSRARQQGTSDWGWRGTVSGELHFTEDKAIQVEIEAAKEKYKQRIRTVSLLKTDTAAEPAAQQATAITAENDIEKLANDFRTYPTQVLSAVINNGQASMLYKAAGVRSADAFSGLPIADQAEAYAKFVQDGGTKAKGLPADYNEWVRSQESDAESRRMQGERTIRQANGKPFKTEASAQQAIERFGLAETHEVNPVDGGFELQKLTPAAQLERRRKAEGKESYTEAQDAVMRQLGIEANYDGEYDLTEAQWADVERRVDARLRGGVATESYTQPEAAAPAYADDAELQDALSHLGDVLGDVFGAKLNITGKQYGASDLLPAMSKVIELLIKKGFKSFRESVGAATNAMRGNANTKGFVDQITPRQWKAAYNSVAEFHEGTESEEDVAKYSAEQIQKIIALPERIKEAEQATNHDATPGQKEAGNYAKGKFAWQGLTIAVETAKGEDRTDKETNGEKWRVTMPATYGYVLATEGADGDHVDVFMGSKPESQRVYVVNQTKPGSTEFDEHKVMLGYDTEDKAMVDYLLSFTGTFGHSVLGSISGPYSIDDFKSMLESNRLKHAKPISDRLAYVNPRVEESNQLPPGVRINGAKEKAAAERLAQLLDKMDQVRMDRNTPEGAAKGSIRSAIEELRKERSVGDIPGLLDTAAQRLFRRYSAFSDVASEVAESLRAADKYAETVAKFKAKQESGIALSDIEVDRQSNGTGRIKTYKQRADEALSEIDERMGLGKQLLECLNS